MESRSPPDTWFPVNAAQILLKSPFQTPVSSPKPRPCQRYYSTSAKAGNPKLHVKDRASMKSIVKSSSPRTPSPQHLAFVWQKYLPQGESKPYTSMTSTSPSANPGMVRDKPIKSPSPTFDFAEWVHMTPGLPQIDHSLKA